MFTISTGLMIIELKFFKLTHFHLDSLTTLVVIIRSNTMHVHCICNRLWADFGWVMDKISNITQAHRMTSGQLSLLASVNARRLVIFVRYSELHLEYATLGVQFVPVYVATFKHWLWAWRQLERLAAVQYSPVVETIHHSWNINSVIYYCWNKWS